ncbi:MAG: hypothetical protein U5S82_00310 [Gammaproteobacteria bacterium]|nr:hypothetical protein [Gammaproteobacteria bacterium]
MPEKNDQHAQYYEMGRKDRERTMYFLERDVRHLAAVAKDISADSGLQPGSVLVALAMIYGGRE